MEKEFCTYSQALRLKALGFDEPCLAYYQKSAVIGDDTILPIQIRDQVSNFNDDEYSKLGVPFWSAPTFSQAINFLYICSNKQIDIELKASDTYEERLRKIDQGCEDLWNLQNSKSN